MTAVSDTGAEATPDVTPSGSGAVLGRALGWSLLNNVVVRIGSLAVSVVLARLLVPADYGVYAVALVVLTALLSCNELGVSLAVVRWPGDVRAIAGTVNAIALLSSVVVTALGVALAGPVAQLLGVPSATGVIRLLCLAALVDGACSVQAALLTREFRQKETALVEITGLVVSSTVSLVLAVRGHGAYSLAWGQLAGNVLVAAALTARCRPGPGLAVRLEVVRPLLAFGLPLAGSSALVFVMLNLDYVVVGHLLGSTQLGLYFVGFNLAAAPVTLLSVALRRVTMPALARTRDEGGDVGSAFSHALGGVLMLVVPAGAFLALHGPALVALIYGSAWREAGLVLAVLALFAVVRIVADLSYDVLATLGRSRTVLAVQAGWLALLLLALPLGAVWGGIRGVAAAHLAVGCAFVVPAFLRALARAGLTVGPLRRLVAHPVAAALVIVPSGVVLDARLSGVSLLAASAALALVTTVLIGLPVYRRVVRLASTTAVPAPVPDDAPAPDSGAGRSPGAGAGPSPSGRAQTTS